MDQRTKQEIEQQRAYYEGRAGDFDRLHLGSRLNRCHLAKIKRIHRHLQVGPEQRVLEVGTGTGIHASWLLEMEPVRYVGVDLSPTMLDVARQRLGDDIELIEAAAEQLPFEQASFDAVYCSGTLHHVADKALAISEMSRVVRPGGRIVISEPNPWNPLNTWALLRNPYERGQREMRVSCLVPWLRQSGLAVKHTEFFNFTPPKPQAFTHLYDFLDGLVGTLPMIKRVGSMLLLVAEKPQV